MYPTNDWVDTNAFFTVGRGMARGLVPYRDLFEQKGPLVYALHALASLISRQTFLGVYLLEIISLTVYLVLMWKTILLWSERHDHFFAMFPALIIPLAFLTVNTHAFALGGSAEEWCLPFMAGVDFVGTLRTARPKSGYQVDGYRTFHGRDTACFAPLAGLFRNPSCDRGVVGGLFLDQSSLLPESFSFLDSPLYIHGVVYV